MTTANETAIWAILALLFFVIVAMVIVDLLHWTLHRGNKIGRRLNRKGLL